MSFKYILFKVYSDRYGCLWAKPRISTHPRTAPGYMVGLRWASVRAAQSDINEDLHAAELKYTVLNVFKVMVLIIAACLLGLMSNTTLSNNSTQTHDLFRLYMIRSKQLFLTNWLWAWNIYLFEWLKFDLTTNRNMNNNGKGLLNVVASLCWGNNIHFSFNA